MMEKKIVRIYIIILAMGTIFFAVVAPHMHPVIYDRSQSETALHWEREMEESTDGISTVYKKVLPTEGTAGKVVAFNSAHVELEVAIDGEMVYSLVPEEGHCARTTGYCWNFVSLTKEDGGKELTVRITPIYADKRTIDAFYYGGVGAVERMIIKERTLRFSVAALILLVGVLLLLYVLLIMKKAKGDMSLLHFATFAVLLGTWYLCESQILELFWSGHVAVAALDHLALMLVTVPFILFIRQMYSSKDHWIWDVLGFLTVP